MCEGLAQVGAGHAQVRKTVNCCTQAQRIPLQAHTAPKTHTWALSASHCKRTRPRKRTHGQSPCLRTSSRHWQTALWLGPAVSPVTLSLHLSIVGAFDDDVGPQVFLKFKHVDFFSLPSFVSRSSAHFSQLISQIGPNWAKSGWHEEHSEVHTDVRIDWADSVLIKLNQRKKYKLALLLSGHNTDVPYTTFHNP